MEGLCIPLDVRHDLVRNVTIRRDVVNVHVYHIHHHMLWMEYRNYAY